MNAVKAGDSPALISRQKLEERTDAPRTPPVIDSASLFGSKTEILIAHAGAYYRLKITRQGKLILNK